ncbi:MAG: NAD(P)/FAD-dependent oxidoreductase [Patescibacteria group bacterium]|nr:NAD(P)/FAD-dependent oxidoreductase [Patescibacteria group bacterium]
MPNEIFDLIIIGAGPSGLFTALQIEKDLKLLILEKSEVPAQKLLLSAK